MATAHQLARLIDGVKDANDWSDPDLVRNAKEKGHVLSKSNISRFRNPVVSIKGEVILALAAGLRVAPSQVAVAAIESMGVHLPQHELPTPEQAVKLDTTLSNRDKESVLALLRHLRDSAAAAGASAEAEAQEARLRADQLDNRPDNLGAVMLPDHTRVDGTKDGKEGHDLSGGEVG
jgi:hypothetical protein